MSPSRHEGDVLDGAGSITAHLNQAARGDHDCDDVYADLAFGVDGVALSSKTISVDLSTSHAEQACGFSTAIPLAKFLPVAPKGSVLEELAKAAASKK